MSNNHFFPESKFNIDINLDVVITSISAWDGIDKTTVENSLKEMQENGELKKLLSTIISEHLQNKCFDEYTYDQPFDRLCFEVVEVK